MLRFILPVLVLAVFVAPALAEYQLEIGPDTTVIDGPLNPDGTINYLAYLNEKLSEGVTPENNFAVDVAMTMGEDAWPKNSFREIIFNALKVEARDTDALVFLRFEHYIEKYEVEDYWNDPQYQAWLDTISYAWAAEDHPEVKRWLDKQDSALDFILRSLNQKDQYYFPLIPGEGYPESIDIALLPWLSQIRGIARGFQARAQLKVAAGDLEAAWSDVRAMYLMAHLSMQEPYTISWLVGVSIYSMAASVVDDIAGSEKLTQKFVGQIIAENQHLSRIRPYWEVYNSGERIASLEMVMHYWKGHGHLFPEPYEGPGVNLLPKEIYELMESEQFDPNVTLRAINAWGNQLISIGQMDDYHERIAKADQMERVAMIRSDHARGLLKNDPGAARLMQRDVLKSNRVTAMATSLVVGWIFPVSGTLYKTEARVQMQLAFAPVALAIGGYHAEHGEYPADLNALVPVYLDSLPIDFATGELPVYRIEDGAAIVYSLGTNLKDDGGVDDPQDGDIVFRIER